jgi:hypothetical protein
MVRTELKHGWPSKRRKTWCGCGDGHHSEVVLTEGSRARVAMSVNHKVEKRELTLN